ncbi:MAG: hypothetical protein IT204_16280 [Fimbriimonadaceae bacterium]|nr:hypothetical protein [Fimbriimonadaceae bacterium]
MNYGRVGRLWSVLLALVAVPVGAAPALQITGRVADGAGAGLAGVEVTFSEGIAPATTAANGSYAAAVHTGALNKPITVTPRKAGYAFQPTSRQVIVSTSDATANFTGTAFKSPVTVSLSVEAHNLAPATALPGQDVPLLKLLCKANGGAVKVTGLKAKEGGSIAFDKTALKVVGATGSLTGTPVVNGSDRSWSITFPTAQVIQAGSTAVFYLIEAVGPGTAGSTAKLYVSQLAADKLVTGQVPASSGTTSIVSPPALTVAAHSLAPATANPGQANVPMLKIGCTAVGGAINVRGLELQDTGTVPGSKLALNVIAGSGAVAANTTYNGTSKVWNITFHAAVTVAAGATSFFYVQESVGSGTAGTTLQLALKQVAVTAPAVVSGSFPQTSAVTSIVDTSKPTLTVTAHDLAPATANEGQADVPMLKLVGAATNGAVSVTGLVVQEQGSVPADKVFLKVNATPPVSGAPTFSASTRTWTFNFANPLSVPAGGNAVIYLLESFGQGTAGKTAKLTVKQVKVASPAVVAGSVPASSSATSLVTPPVPALLVDAHNLAPATAPAGSKTPMLKLVCTAQHGPVKVSGLVLQDLGSIAASRIGIEVQGPNGVLTGSPAFNLSTKTWTITFPQPLTVAVGSTVYLYCSELIGAQTAGSTVKLAVNGVKVSAPAVIGSTLPQTSTVTTVQ